MIDRKVLTTGLAFIALMLVLALWRVSLLPDWTLLPRFSDSGALLPDGSTMRFLHGPLALGFFTLVLGIRFAPGDTRQRTFLRTQMAYMVAGLGLLFTLLQVYFVARSFGVILDSALAFRAAMVFLGILFLTFSNALPKFSRVRSACCGGLDDGQSARFLRFTGYCGVALGLVFIAAGVAAPREAFAPIAWSAIAAFNVAVLLYRARLAQGERA